MMNSLILRRKKRQKKTEFKDKDSLSEYPVKYKHDDKWKTGKNETVSIVFHDLNCKVLMTSCSSFLFHFLSSVSYLFFINLTGEAKKKNFHQINVKERQKIYLFWFTWYRKKRLSNFSTFFFLFKNYQNDDEDKDENDDEKENIEEKNFFLNWWRFQIALPFLPPSNQKTKVTWFTQ